MNGRRTVASVHNDWLTLVEPVGAFLTIPVLKRVFPNGIPPVERDIRGDVRRRLEELTTDVASRTGWHQWILRDLLSLGARLRETSAIPAGLTHTVAERHTTLRPDFAIVEPQEGGADKTRMLGIRWPFRTALDRRPTTDERGQPTDWAATPLERAALLCRAVGVPLALVTDTDRFALVWAPANGPSGHAIWPSSLFGEERLLLDSFVALLGAQRFFGVAEKETLEALLTESGSAQTEVTGKLGEQVRKAVELLIDAFSRADRAAGGRILSQVPPAQVYNAAVTVMMRLVVLLAAEERRLLPADDPIYSASYSILTTRDQLERDAMRDGIETLEKRHAAWHRLLATFRAVHAGIEHDRLRLPAYGGSLFDPARYPFLDSPPIPVDDRAMLAVLDALQVLTFRQGSVTEARRISYLNLDVEQIGHVYEGLLDHGCTRVDEVVLGLVGSKGEEPEVALSELERELTRGEGAFAAWLTEKGGPTVATIRKRLFEELEPDQDHRLRAACDNDQATYDRVRPFGGLLRKDLRDLPAVFMPGSLYVTQVSLRRDSGTAYTTKELADEVVRYALEPLVYSPGPAEGAEPGDWKLKPSADLLRLKVCDPAVGSGAILVAACRYLADRLVEAWKAETGTGPMPAILEGIQESEWSLVARRSVTDHCLYGVDRNPMALEMARLSLWLTTMAKERPFTFLDHQIRSGDSLLGITSLEQVRWVHIDPERGKKLWAKRPLFTDPRKAVDARVSEALEKSRALAAIDVISLRDVERKSRLHAEMVEALVPLDVLADMVVGAALAEAGGQGKVDALLESIANRVEEAFSEREPAAAREGALAEVRDHARFWLDTDRPDDALDRNCLHWPLTFPEVFIAPGRSGFDAVVGNPPFIPAARLRSAVGDAYKSYLASAVVGGALKKSDLIACFFRRASGLTSQSLSLLATNSLAQGDTNEVSLQPLVGEGLTIFRAVKSCPWPGSQTLEISKTWLWNGEWKGSVWLDGEFVIVISPQLESLSVVRDEPRGLFASTGLSFRGSSPLGTGFILSREEVKDLIANDPQSVSVVHPYLTGEDLNGSPSFEASRWIIDFREMSELEARTYRGAWARVAHTVFTERQAKDRDRYPRMVNEWWKHWNTRPALYAAIAPMTRVIAIAQVSKTLMPSMVSARQVFSEQVIVLAMDSGWALACLSSGFHYWWALLRGSSMRTDARYTPTTCFETFPMPQRTPILDELGEQLHRERVRIMSRDRIGMTALYVAVHAPEAEVQGIDAIRDLHASIDIAVARAYGLSPSDLDLGFHDTRLGIRFGIGNEAQRLILDRLLELNLQRYAEEVVQGLHEKPTAKGKGGSATRRGRKPKASPLLEGV